MAGTVCSTGEVEIPAYRRLHDEARLGGRVRDIVIAGVSTRKYRKVLPQVAASVGIAKSSVSRRFIEASAAQLAALQKRRFDDVELLAIYIDGIVVAGRHVVVAIGVDASGAKHLLGGCPLWRARSCTTSMLGSARSMKTSWRMTGGSRPWCAIVC